MVKREVPSPDIPETVSFKAKLQAPFIAYKFPEGILACCSLVKPVLVLLA